VRVVAVYPHDPEAFTQGLVWHQGALYESTGLYGRSTLRRVDLASGAVVRRVDLPPRLFGEGLALVGDRLVQLTWQEGLALVWGVERFERRGERRYQGEGWGLCHDGRRLVMSDGSGRLVFRDPETFAAVGELAVTVGGRPAERLNELECVGSEIWANVWGSGEVLRIDAASGRVTAVADASGLLSPLERAGTDVLNGIAHRPETGTFLLTGKLWPKLFEVAFEAER
jgi:glutaminyl-peptide cyclotransferase